MAAIESIYAHSILDSRGNPTLEVILQTDDGCEGHGIVPSGASTGEREAIELRDGDMTQWGGKGVSHAVQNVNEVIAPALIGMDASDQRAVDMFLCEIDNTENKSNLGANAILGVSLAALRASAQSAHLPLYRYIGGTNTYVLPVPNFNVINGGEHVLGSKLQVQEFMLSPYGFDTFADALRAGAETYHALKDVLMSRHLSVAVGDEGGFAPDLSSHEEVLDILSQAIEKAGYKPGKDIGFCIDAAANSFYKGKTKTYYFEGEDRSAEWMIHYYKRIISSYPVVSLEDPFSEHDGEAFVEAVRVLGDFVQIMGDDLIVTNPEYIKEAIAEQAITAALIKPNQVGTISETLDAIDLVLQSGLSCMVSHRSGETADTTIADLCVAKNIPQIKSGAPARYERVAKYNRLVEIEEQLGSISHFAGPDAFARARVLAGVSA